MTYAFHVALVTASLLLPLALQCSIRHDVHPEIRYLDYVSDGGVMNMSLHLVETARITVDSLRGRRLSFTRYFPSIDTLRADLDTLKIITADQHSIPWIQKAADGLAVTFVVTSLDDVTINFEYDIFIKDEASLTECRRIFSGAVYAIEGEECSTGHDDFKFHYNQTRSNLAAECVTSFTSPVESTNVTLHTSSQPKTFQIALKCYGGSTCTCSCQTEITDFCRGYLTERAPPALFPPSWGPDTFMLFVIVFFVLAVCTQISFGVKFSLTGPILLFFNICTSISIGLLLISAVIIPIHIDASYRTCTAVFENRHGSYSVEILFWVYVPYFLTLLIATGFVDNTELVVSINGRLSLFFQAYQIASPLVQTWLFLYVHVVPLKDALLLTLAVVSLFGVRCYFRNPFFRV